MPEKDKKQELDPLVQSLNLFHKGYAYTEASQYTAQEMGINPDEVTKYGYGWEDEHEGQKYYISIKHSVEPPPWGGFFGLHKPPTYEWININAPVNPHEHHNARGLVKGRVSLMLGKIKRDDFLSSPEINRTVWWKTSAGKDFHSSSDHFPETMQDVLNHLSAPYTIGFPAISFLYFPLPHLQGGKSTRYERRPFHLPSEYVKAAMRNLY